MNQTTIPDQTADLFETPNHSPIAVLDNTSAAISVVRTNEAVLYGLLTTIKWVFLYLPGAVAIHFSMMALSLSLFYNDWSSYILIGSFGIILVSSFMVMFGLGKMTDLKYLRVVGALAAAGGLASIVYSILTAFTGGDFFGWFTLLSIPFTLLVAQLIKKNTDTKSDV